MKFNEIPEYSENSLQFGVNQLKLAQIVRKEGDPEKKIGPNLNFVFTNEYEVNGETKEGKNFYTYYLKGAFKTEEAWKLKAQIHQLIDVRAAITGEEEAKSFYNDLSNNAPEINNEDASSCYDWEEKFVLKLLEPCLGKNIPVVLHYKGKYLNIPSAKENDYKLPFGLNPHVGVNLKKEAQKDVVETIDTTTPTPKVDNSGW